MLNDEEDIRSVTRIEQMSEGILAYLRNFKEENPETNLEDIAVAVIDAATLVAVFLNVGEVHFMKACEKVYKKHRETFTRETNE